MLCCGPKSHLFIKNLSWGLLTVGNTSSQSSWRRSGLKTSSVRTNWSTGGGYRWQIVRRVQCHEETEREGRLYREKYGYTLWCLINWDILVNNPHYSWRYHKFFLFTIGCFSTTTSDTQSEVKKATRHCSDVKFNVFIINDDRMKRNVPWLMLLKI